MSDHSRLKLISGVVLYASFWAGLLLVGWGVTNLVWALLK